MFDVQYFIPNSLIASFLRSFVQHVHFVKGRGTCSIVGKETLKFGLIFESLPDFPSLRPYVKRERSQVTMFLLSYVW